MKKCLFLTLVLFTSAILMQGFQCASRELTTAKVALQNKEYDKAETNLNQELAKNPNSQEALMLLVDVKFAKYDIFGASEVLKKVQTKVTDPKLIGRIPLLISKIWVESYNSGTEALNSFYQSKRQSKLDSAIKFFDTGLYFRPRIADFEYFKGMCYEADKDTDGKLKSFKSYIDIMTPEINLMASKGLTMGMEAKTVVEKIGKPAGFRPTPNPGKKDTSFTGMFLVDGKEAYIFFQIDTTVMKKKLIGLRYDLPDSWLPEEKAQIIDFKTSVIQQLMGEYYQLKKYDEALKYAELLYQLAPTDENFEYVISLDIELNKSSEAIDKLKAAIAKDPKGANNYMQLGYIYFTLKEFDNSITNYEKALELQPDNEIAPRNLGSAFKNKAALMQKNQIDANEKDKSVKIEPEKYKPFLDKAASNYEKALKMPKWKDDFGILTDMSEIYYLLDNKESLKKSLNNLESIEASIKDEDKEKYYINLMKLYGYVKNTEKLTETEQKLNNLK